MIVAIYERPVARGHHGMSTMLTYPSLISRTSNERDTRGMGTDSRKECKDMGTSTGWRQ